MLQSYKKGEEYIARARNEYFQLHNGVKISKENGYIRVGGLKIDTNNLVSVAENHIYYDDKEYQAIGAHVMNFNVSAQRMLFGAQPIKDQPKLMTIHNGKVHPITSKSVFKYGVLQNPEPFIGLSPDQLKKAKKEAQVKLDAAVTTGMLLSKAEVDRVVSLVSNNVDITKLKEELENHGLAPLTYLFRIMLSNGVNPTDAKKKMRDVALLQEYEKVDFNYDITPEVI